MTRQQKTDSFVERFGEELMQEICEACADQRSTDRVKLSDHVQVNACNAIDTGTFWVDGTEHCFRLMHGDMNGADIELTDGLQDIDYKPPVRYFVPNSLSLRARKIYQAWRSEEWFKKAESAMNYDYHFAPGVKTQNHYREFAAQKGMRIETDADIAALMAPISDSDLKAEQELRAALRTLDGL